MIETGLEMVVDSTRAQSGAAQFNAAMDSMAANSERAVDQVRRSLAYLNSSIFNLQNALLGIGIGGFIKSLVDAQLQFNQINFTLQAATGSAEGATYEYNFLSDMVRKLGLNLQVTGQQFALFEAAAKGTSIQGDQARAIFEGFGTAISGLHLPAERAALVLGAVQRMMSTNVVNARELRLQLATNLPGGFKAAADAMGMTQSKLNDLMKSGQLFATDLLPKMAALLKDQYSAAAEKAANTTQGLINRFHTALFNLKLDIGTGGFGKAFEDSLRRVVEFMESSDMKRVAHEIGEALAIALNLATDAFIFLGDHAREVLAIMVAFTATKTALFFVQLGLEIRRVALALGELQGMQKVLAFFNGNSLSTAAVVPTAAQSAATVVAGGTVAKNAAAPTLDTLKDAAIAAGLLQKTEATKKATEAVKDLGVAEGEMAYFTRTGWLEAEELSKRIEKQPSLFKDAEVGVGNMGKQMSLFGVEVAAGATATEQLAAKSTTLLGRLGAMATAAASSAKAFLLMAVTSPVTMLVNLATAADTALVSLGAFAVANPFTVLLIAIAAVVTGLYLMRDSTFEITVANKQEVFKIRDIWNAWFIGMKENWQDTKNFVGQMMIAIRDHVTGFFGDHSAIDGFFKKIQSGIEYVRSLFSKMIPDSVLRLLEKARTERQKTEKETPRDPGVKPPNGPPGANGNDAKAQRDRAADAIAKLKEEIAFTRDSIMVNEAYAHQLVAGNDALATLNATRLAEEKIIQLGTKATDAQKNKIREYYQELEHLKMVIKAVQEIRQTLIADDLKGSQLDEMAEALKRGESAVAALNVKQAVQNELQKIGLGQTREEVELMGIKAGLTKIEIHDLLDKWEAIKKSTADIKIKEENQALEQQALAMKAQLNPTTALINANEHLNRLYATGVLSLQEYNLAVRDMQRQWDESVNAILEKSQRWQDGVLVGMRKIQMESQDVAKNVEAAFTTSFTKLEDMITTFLDTGKFKFSDFEKTVLHEVNNLFVKQVGGSILGSILGKDASGNPDTSKAGIFGGTIDKLFGTGRPDGSRNSPMWVRDAGAGGLGDIFSKGGSNSDSDNVTGLWKDETDKVGGMFKGITDKMPDWFKNAFSGIGGFFQKFLGGLLGGGGSSGGGLFGGGNLGGGIFSLFGGGKGGSSSGGGDIFSLFGDGGGAEGSTDLLSGIFDGFSFAKGGIMTDAGALRLQHYSNGGVASSPQLAMYGEKRRPEAYVPLPDGRSIPVTMTGDTKTGGGQIVMQNTFVFPNSNADSFRRSQDQVGADLQRAMERAVRRNQ